MRGLLIILVTEVVLYVKNSTQKRNDQLSYVNLKDKQGSLAI